MEKLSFDRMPESLQELNEKVDTLISMQKNQTPEKDRFMKLDELVEYLPERPSKATVYRWVSQRKIPVHKEGKSILFKKSEINKWLKNGRSMQFLEL
ncbi:MAG: helix-turn-helix domain-containing protein [Bacteroidales bacterium]